MTRSDPILVTLEAAALRDPCIPEEALSLNLDWQSGGEGEDNVSWEMVGLEGKWDGHSMGPFTLNAAMFDQMVQAFDAQGKKDTVVDYEHASVFGSDQSPAAGWIKELERREVDGMHTLWARIAWTQRAADYIRASEYKYKSPTIIFNSRDRKTGRVGGARLHSVALTNTPFLSELPEVRLNSLRVLMTQQEEDPMTPEQFKALCKALKLDPEKTSAEQVMAALGELQNNHEALFGTLVGCREALGVAEDADVVAAAQQARVAATAVDGADIAALRVQISTLEERDKARAAAELVAANQRLGKVQGNDTENHKACLAWATRDAKGFEAYMATLPKGAVAPVTVQLTGDDNRGLPVGEGNALDGETAEERAIAAKYREQLDINDEDVKAATDAGLKFNL